MRCEQCHDAFCQFRLTIGECRRFPNGEKVEQAVIFTAPDTGLHIVEPSPETIKEMEAISHLASRGYTIITPDGIDVPALQKAASDLVDAVERYMRQECLRSELMLKKDKLKALLHE